MPSFVQLGRRKVGANFPCYIIAEAGINHNGDLETAKRLIDVAKEAGCDAIKFQKRNPDKCVPEDMRNHMRETPWGYITYLDYRYKVEFSLEQFKELDACAKSSGIEWFASCWDVDSIEFMAGFDTPCIKIPSALITHQSLLKAAAATGKPVMISSGMSTMEQIHQSMNLLESDKRLLAHSTSTYPCPKHELNLRMIRTLQEAFECPIGYSGHEAGLATTVAAVTLGACFVERHITLSRSMWGSDHAASIEPSGLARLVKDIRGVEMAMGDGVKCVYESERPALKRLRLVDDLISGRKEY